MLQFNANTKSSDEGDDEGVKWNPKRNNHYNL